MTRKEWRRLVVMFWALQDQIDTGGRTLIPHTKKKTPQELAMAGLNTWLDSYGWKVGYSVRSHRISGWEMSAETRRYLTLCRYLEDGRDSTLYWSHLLGGVQVRE